MKTRNKLIAAFLILSAIAIISLPSCTKSNGDVTFWLPNNFVPPITVTVTGQGTKTATSYYTSGITGCNVTGCANFNLPPATYSFSAYNGDSTLVWSGNDVVIAEKGCLQYKLNN